MIGSIATPKDRFQKALESGNLAEICNLFDGKEVKASTKYRARIGVATNGLHYFCSETNPSGTFFFTYPPYYEGKEPIFKLSLQECKQIITFLVSKKISLEAKDSVFEQTPLSTAIGYDNTTAALALIELIIDDKNLTKEKKTNVLNGFSGRITCTNPLLLSIQKANMPVFVSLLNTFIVNVNVKDKFGLTPLHWAVIMGLPKMVEALLYAGADPEAITNNGKKPLDYLEVTLKDLLAPPQTKFLFGNTITVFDNDGSALPELRPIIAHFNNDRELFVRMRKEKMISAEKEIAHLIRQSIQKNNPQERSKNMLLRSEKIDADLLFSIEYQQVLLLSLQEEGHHSLNKRVRDERPTYPIVDNKAEAKRVKSNKN